MGTEVRAPWEILPQQAISVLVGTALPRAVRITEVDRQGGFFLNLSRGELVDDEALLGALESGHLSEAALDVGRAPDQMPAPALARHPLVIATPHIGGLTPEAARHQTFDTVRQVRALLAGQAPEGAVNLDKARRLGLVKAV